MIEQKPGVIAVGEVMIELTRGPDGRYGLAFGGDTFNTAVYLARAGIDVAYATALGDDPYSDALLALAAAEGVHTELIVRVPDRTAGLYLVETNANGERSFCYWRDHAPARDLFELPQWGVIAERLLACRLIDRKSTRLNSQSRENLVCRLLLEKKKKNKRCKQTDTKEPLINQRMNMFIS